MLWYRLLVGHAPLDAGAARDFAVHLIAAGQAAGSPDGADGRGGAGSPDGADGRGGAGSLA